MKFGQVFSVITLLVASTAAYRPVKEIGPGEVCARNGREIGECCKGYECEWITSNKAICAEKKKVCFPCPYIASAPSAKGCYESNLTTHQSVPKEGNNAQTQDGQAQIKNVVMDMNATRNPVFVFQRSRSVFPAIVLEFRNLIN